MAQLDTKQRDNLDDSDFAYIDKNGDKHLPIHDAAHVRNALARFNQTHFDSPEDKTKAMSKIKSKAKELGVKVSAMEYTWDKLSHDHKAYIYPLTEIKAGENGQLPPKIQILPIGKWDTVPYDTLEITASDCEEMIKNFADKVRAGDSLPIDVDHDGKQAAGWMTALELQADGLWASVEWTDLGKLLLGEKRYKFFSPEFNPDYTDPENKHKKLTNVLIGGGLVNRPLFKELKPLVANDHLTEKRTGIMLFIEHMDLKELKKRKTAGESLTADEEAYVKANDKADEEKEAEIKAKAKKADEEKAESEAEKKKEEEAKKAKEPQMRSISAAEYDALKKMADRGVEAADKLEAKEINEKVTSWMFSETGGKFAPAIKEDLVSFYKTLDETQRKTFGELVDKMPEQKALFNEYGSAEVLTPGKKADILTVRAREIMEKTKGDKKPMKFSEAMKQAVRENPELGETYAVPSKLTL